VALVYTNPVSFYIHFLIGIGYVATNLKKTLFQLFLVLSSFGAAVVINKLITAELVIRYVFVSQSSFLFFAEIVMQTVVVYLVIRQWMNRRADKTSSVLLWGFYFLVLVSFLFLRSRGVSGVSLSPFSFIQDAANNSDALWMAAMNIALFLPIGYLLRKQSLLLSVLSILGIVLAIESAQYLLSLGFFDLGDMLLNISGFSMGYSIFKRKM
jgi:glycopeptide antibiotics resistance protein